MSALWRQGFSEGKDSCVLSQQRPKPLIVLANHRWLIPRINGLTGCPQVRPSHFLFPAPLSLSNDPPQFNRRHHCRRCGRLVCSSCSTKKMVVEGCRENPARVCDQCYSYFNKEWVSCSGATAAIDQSPLPGVLTNLRVSWGNASQIWAVTESFLFTFTLKCH